MTQVTVRPCPQCQRPCTQDASNPFMPFCSRRCKDADFLHWANDEHRIAGLHTPWTDHESD
ncbi:MAG: DNA gyrase inhibitor YacG [Gammaproteobacteria bacterium]|nr:MAG: DNA gyrase inhibitor YacG [Gammaproteobacteria bacterium]